MPVQRRVIHIAELDCAEEVLQLRSDIEDRPGVEQLDFDVLNRWMRVTFADELVSTDEIIGWVTSLGMRASLAHESLAHHQDSRWQRHGRSVLTAAAGLLAAAGFATHAFSVNSVAAALGWHAGAHSGRVPVVSAGLYSLSIIAGVWLVAPKAWAALRRRRADMNLLMCLAVIGAVALGQWLEAAVVTCLFSLALLLEQWSMGRARRAIASLLDLAPPTARCVDRETRDETEGNVDEVRIGDLILVRPGERIALDGLVRSGESSVNQAPITGESLPVDKGPGATVYAGTINGEGTLQVTVTRAAEDTTLARIIHLVQEAQASRAASEQWVERFARWYTPAMIALAMSVAIVPPLLLSASWTSWAYNALVLLVIACPCALVISTPVSIVSALTAAARNGVLIKGGRHLEAAAGIRAVAFDKTGTLTRGAPVVREILPLNGHSRQELLQRAAAMESHSNHPIATAVRQCAQREGIEAEDVQEYRILSGRGAEATFRGKTFWIGSHRLLTERIAPDEQVSATAAQLQQAGNSVVAIGNDKHVCGLISVTDEIRPTASRVVAALRAEGVRRIVLVTGDNQATAQAVARQVGVDECFAESLPEEKVRHVNALRQQYGSVAMIGDGVNDAPALAAANLGIAMGAIGTDTAIETADIALMSDDLDKIPWLMAHARRTLAVIKQNIAVALGLKLLFVALTLAGAATLWMAIAADMGASLLVIANGLRLLKA